MQDHLFFIFVLVAALAIGCVGGAMLWRSVIGGWAKRFTHSCGWFEIGGLAWPTPGSPCPRCGKIDNAWRWRVGRPIPMLPVGWEWKDDA